MRWSPAGCRSTRPATSTAPSPSPTPPPAPETPSCCRPAARPTTSTATTRNGATTSRRWWRNWREGVRDVASKSEWMRTRSKQQPLEHRLLLTATFCLLAGGAVMVYSASSARTLLQGQGDGTAYLIKYVAYGAVGLIGMNIVSRVPLDVFKRFTPLLLLIAFGLLLLVLMAGFGGRIKGARRGIGAGPLQFQPSEIMKLALVLHAAAMLSARPKIARS